jgi:hypothetical protein
MYMTNLIKQIVDEHNKNRNDNIKMYLERSLWWKQVGACYCIFPRQSGKTQAIIELYKETPNSKILVYSQMMKKILIDRDIDKKDILVSSNKLDNFWGGIDTPNTNLFVDEFMYCENLNSLYTRDWKTLTLVGSMR